MNQIKYPFPQVIDSSMLGTLKSCHQKFNKSYIQEWKPRGLSVHLHAGKAYASALEETRIAFYERGESAESAVASGLGKLISTYGDFECPSDSAKSLERMLGAFEFYWENYPLGQNNSYPITLPSGRRGVEFTFAHPLPILHPQTGDPLLYSGAMDAIYHHAGDIYIIDEKTTTQLGATWTRQWDLRAQFTGYAWGCREAGIRVAGAIVRGVSILKTKYDTAEAITYRPNWQINRWYEEMLILVNRAIECWKQDEWLHDLDSACAEYGGCQFRQCCQSEDETPWLETSFERRHWDPVARKETLLDPPNANLVI
jgi:hypothetical protein